MSVLLQKTTLGTPTTRYLPGYITEIQQTKDTMLTSARRKRMVQIFPHDNIFHVFMHVEIIPERKHGVTCDGSVLANTKGVPGHMECLACFGSSPT